MTEIEIADFLLSTKTYEQLVLAVTAPDIDGIELWKYVRRYGIGRKKKSVKLITNTEVEGKQPLFHRQVVIVANENMNMKIIVKYASYYPSRRHIASVYRGKWDADKKMHKWYNEKGII